MKGRVVCSSILYYLFFPLTLFLLLLVAVLYLLALNVVGLVSCCFKPQRVRRQLSQHGLLQLQNDALAVYCPNCTYEHLYYAYEWGPAHSLHLAYTGPSAKSPGSSSYSTDCAPQPSVILEIHTLPKHGAAKGADQAATDINGINTHAENGHHSTPTDAESVLGQQPVPLPVRSVAGGIYHSPISSETKRCNKPDMVIVHGTGSSSASWIPILEDLARTYNLHIVDLPGFGRSEGPWHLRHGTCEETIAFYIGFLRRFFQHAGLTKAVLLAHSYGAFLSVHFANAHPELVSQLFLACAAGTFSTQSEKGAWMSLLFSVTAPQTAAQLLGAFGMRGFFTLYDMQAADIDMIETYYRWQLWLGSTAHHTVGSFIARGWRRVYWKHPMLNTLLQLPMPVALFYGEHDNIIPPHNGLTLAQLGAAPCYVIKGATHSPFFGPHGKHRFASAIREAGSTARPFGAVSAALGASLTPEYLNQWMTSYSLGWSRKDLQRQYAALQAKAIEAGVQQGKVVWVGEAQEHPTGNTLAKKEQRVKDGPASQVSAAQTGMEAEFVASRERAADVAAVGSALEGGTIPAHISIVVS